MKKDGKRIGFQERIEQRFALNLDREMLLGILIPWLRFYDTLRIRAEGHTEFLKEKIRIMMRELSLKKYQIRRTMVTLAESWRIPKDYEGAKIYAQLVAAFGEDNVASWVEKKSVEIPARTEVTFKVTDAGKKAIAEKKLEDKVLKILGNTPSVRIGAPPPKRDRKKARRRKPEKK